MHHARTNYSNPALTRIPFVGRTDVLGTIEQIVSSVSERPTVIFMEGHGGVGKTEVLNEVLARYRQTKDGWHVAIRIVDAYHPDARTQLGFPFQVVGALPPAALESFQSYLDSYRLYRSQNLSGGGSTEYIPLRPFQINNYPN